MAYYNVKTGKWEYDYTEQTDVQSMQDRITELEQQLASRSFYAKECADGFDREVKRADRLYSKLTEQDKLLDECEIALKVFLEHIGPTDGMRTWKELLTKLRDRKNG